MADRLASSGRHGQDMMKWAIAEEPAARPGLINDHDGRLPGLLTFYGLNATQVEASDDSQVLLPTYRGNIVRSSCERRQHEQPS